MGTGDSVHFFFFYTESMGQSEREKKAAECIGKQVASVPQRRISWAILSSSSDDAVFSVRSTGNTIITGLSFNHLNELQAVAADVDLCQCERGAQRRGGEWEA